jgi:hypothetical protein
MHDPVAPTTPPGAPPLAALQSAARQLETRGWCVRWDVAACCGVPDARLVVRNGKVGVELLVPAPDEWAWDAVRVKPASRMVWRGPEPECAAEQLVRFVEDLLTRDVEQLPGRWQLLG